MQIRFIMILPAQGYNSLSYPTLLYEVCNTHVSKYKPLWIGQPDQLITKLSLSNIMKHGESRMTLKVYNWVAFWIMFWKEKEALNCTWVHTETFKRL